MRRLTLAAVVAAALAAHAAAQAPEAAPPFEVTSVKRNVTNDRGSMVSPQPGGRFVTRNATLRAVIRSAYRVPDYRLIGGPAWIDTDRFDIQAKATSDVPFPQIMLMVRALLADRFGLMVHNETRDAPIYALVLARRDGVLGEKVRPSQTDCSPNAVVNPSRSFSPGDRPPCGGIITDRSIRAGARTMADVATLLSSRVDRTVVDRTGLSGVFDLDLEWTADLQPPAASAAGAAARAPEDGLTIFTAVQEQLGLRLQPERGPVNIVVIDSVHQPTAD